MPTSIHVHISIWFSDELSTVQRKFIHYLRTGDLLSSDIEASRKRHFPERFVYDDDDAVVKRSRLIVKMSPTPTPTADNGIQVTADTPITRTSPQTSLTPSSASCIHAPTVPSPLSPSGFTCTATSLPVGRPQPMCSTPKSRAQAQSSFDSTVMMATPDTTTHICMSLFSCRKWVSLSNYLLFQKMSKSALKLAYKILISKLKDLRNCKRTGASYHNACGSSCNKNVLGYAPNDFLISQNVIVQYARSINVNVFLDHIEAEKYVQNYQIDYMLGRSGERKLNRNRIKIQEESEHMHFSSLFQPW